ncbi:class I histocompatibility antigen, Gogo-B*0201 alpha chain-like [Gracilinanus agilis]|uniref:class I histocompatibility antigen, Gogo-B*0201 alpha chain-like n=1 Tax=Gracilinanus agilis TaxID=191870 RepID=UPI001CFD8AA0|nr:class I histocompatibility antigen, Gogo-B*0201 alpha chain-like [Gracilinanus agilis]
MEFLVLSLLLLGTQVTENWAGSHSLKYFYTAASQPGLAEPKFTAVIYVDDQQILSFDSDSPSQSMEVRTPWIEQEMPDYWERETQFSREATLRYRMCLQKVPVYYNYSEGGVHTYQRQAGCEVFSNGSFSRGFVQYGFDGRDYLTLDTETLHWIAADVGALNNKRKWEENQRIAGYWKVFLEEECVHSLQRHLENGKERLLRADPPSARVTRHTSSDGEVTLKCRAQDFYPAEISLVWLRDGEEQLQDTEFIETRPAGDGTFQKWAAVEILSGSEHKYTCRVQHEGLPEPLFLKWEPQFSSIGLSAGVVTVLLLAAVIVGVVVWRKNISDRKRGSYTATASNDSTQGSDVSLTARSKTLMVLELERGWCKGDKCNEEQYDNDEAKGVPDF